MSGVLDDLRGLVREETEAVADELTDIAKASLQKALDRGLGLAERVARGEDVSSEAEILRSILLDYRAVVAQIVRNATDRLIDRGVGVAGQFAAGVARGFLAGL